MTQPTQPGETKSGGSRRQFLKSSTGAVVGAGLTAGLGVVPNVHAGVGETIKVGLIGCGGRGSGAAKNAMLAGKDIKLVAMGDVFADRMQASRQRFQADKTLADRFAVDDDHCFSGFDAYKKVTDSVDVVVLGTPPNFRPLHLKYAVEQGKHAFVEKPVAVDAPGVRSILETCELAKKKKLAIVSGLCWRYHQAKREIVKRIHDGAVGNITAMQTDYNTQRPGKRVLAREQGWSDMEYQMRNWYFYTWLSGDHNVEQHIHSLDKIAWVMRDEYPVQAYGMGGRQAIPDNEPGQIYDHHAVCYEFANGVRCYSYCRQQTGTYRGTRDWIFGSKGTALLMEHEITGENPWKFGSTRGMNMYQQEHDELFASIRDGKPINNGEYMAKSTLMAIMGRMATYTGQLITWDQAFNSKQDLSPKAWDWISLPEPEVAIPGLTKFV